MSDLMTASAATSASQPGAPVEPVTTARAGRVLRDHRWQRWVTPGLLLSGAVVALALLWALAPTWFTDVDPLVGTTSEAFTAPSTAHPFGTDQTGRDLYARVVHGAGLSLQATLLAVAISLTVGTALGLLAGFIGGVVDDVVMRTIDVLLAIPGLLLSLMIVTALGFGTLRVAVAVGVAGIAGFARVSRSEVLRVRESLYVEASFTSGARWPAVLLRHVLPGSAGPIISLATLELGTAILAVSSLSFLGYGEPPPTPEWGVLVSEGRDFLAGAWWLATLPGLVIVAVVLSFNRLSRAVTGGHR